MDFGDISWVGTILGALAFFVLGAVWYGPLFGKPWRSLIGVPADSKGTPLPTTLLAAFVANLLASVALAAVLEDDVTWTDGLLGGAILGLLVASATLALQYFFEGRPKKLFLINAGYNVAGLAVAGAIIGAFQ